MGKQVRKYADSNDEIPAWIRPAGSGVLEFRRTLPVQRVAMCKEYVTYPRCCEPLLPPSPVPLSTLPVHGFRRKPILFASARNDLFSREIPADVRKCMSKLHASLRSEYTRNTRWLICTRYQSRVECGAYQSASLQMFSEYAEQMEKYERVIRTYMYTHTHAHAHTGE